MTFNAPPSRYAELKAVEGYEYEGVVVVRVETAGTPKLTKVRVRAIDGQMRSWTELKSAREASLDGGNTPAP